MGYLITSMGWVNTVKVELEIWTLISLLLSFFGFLFAAGRILLTQIEKRFHERFSALEMACYQNVKTASRSEKTFLEFRADLPLKYVRREDHIRVQNIIDTKLDTIYNQLSALQSNSKRNKRD